jgi:hypothetical protein
MNSTTATSATNKMLHLALGMLASDMSGNPKPSSGPEKPVFRSRRNAGKLPTLLLTHAMRMNAFTADRRKAALACNMREVHRIEAEARVVTTAILRKGSCSK